MMMMKHKEKREPNRIRRKVGNGFVNSVINKMPFELHVPGVSIYNFTKKNPKIIFFFK